MKKTLLLSLMLAFFAANAQEVAINLNKNWKFHQAGMPNWMNAEVPGCVHTDLLANKQIENPFYRTNERQLQWIDKVNWEYKSEFDVPADVLQKDRILLDFKGLDTYADVFVNDTKVLEADNMYREWQVDCKKLLKETGNTIRIYFYSPVQKGLQLLENWGYELPATNDQSEMGGLGPNKVSIFTRKAPYHYGWDWGPRFVTSGIWRNIYLKAWSSASISDIYMEQTDVTSKVAKLNANVEINAVGASKKLVEVLLNGKAIASKQVDLSANQNQVSIPFEIKNPLLWWSNGLGQANLYTFKIRISENGKEITSKDITTGLRKIEVVQEPDADGKGKGFYFRLNGKAVFAKGGNYIPNDIFLTRVSPADYESIISSAAKSNMNMLRVWGGGIYENDIFYELCDKYGIMLWQDFMFACSMYPAGDAFYESVKQEAIDNVKRLRNHPSIALWCGNNEMEIAWAPGHENSGWGWKQKYSPAQRDVIWGAYVKLFKEIISEVVAKNTNGFYWQSSPTQGEDVASYESRAGDMHYWGVWHGQHPFSDFNKYKARFMSEYGFQSFPEFKTVQSYTIPADYNIESDVMSSHQRSGIGNLRIKEYMKDWYRDPKDFKSFLYASQILQAEAIKSAIYAHRRIMPYTMGTLFWQINDCWPVASWSSIDYYKRWKALQYYSKKAYSETLAMSYIDGNKLQVFAATDNQSGFNGKVQITVFDLNGDKKWSQEKPLKLAVNKGDLIFEKAVSEIVNGDDAKKTYILVEVSDGKKVVFTDVAYFVNPKDLELTKANITKTIETRDDKTFLVLQSDKLAKNVFLSLKNSDPFFSDNYMDVIPGRKTEIEVSGKFNKEELQSELEMVSLIDTY